MKNMWMPGWIIFFEENPISLKLWKGMKIPEQLCYKQIAMPTPSNQQGLKTKESQLISLSSSLKMLCIEART